MFWWRNKLSVFLNLFIFLDLQSQNWTSVGTKPTYPAFFRGSLVVDQPTDTFVKLQVSMQQISTPFYFSHLLLSLTDMFAHSHRNTEDVVLYCWQNWSKGVVFVNGQNLGRTCRLVLRKALYLPGPWLRSGDNEVNDAFDCGEVWQKPSLMSKLVLDNLFCIN